MGARMTNIPTDLLRTFVAVVVPKLPDLYSGIYVREGGARPIYEQLADEIAEAIFSPGTAQGKLIGSIDSGRKKNSAA